MTDLEKFIALYQSFGIPLTANPYVKEEQNDTWYQLDDAVVAKATYVIKLDPHAYTKLVGYGGFYSQVLFAEDGSFLGQGFWG